MTWHIDDPEHPAPKDGTWWDELLAAENANKDRERFQHAMARVRALEQGDAYGKSPEELAASLAELARARHELFLIIFPEPPR